MPTGIVLVCPHCDGLLEILGEAPRPHELEAWLCDCGGVLMCAEEEPEGASARRGAAPPTAPREG